MPLGRCLETVTPEVDFGIIISNSVLQSSVSSNTLEKKQRQFDRTIQEWTVKVKELQTEVDSAHNEARSYSADLFRIKAQYEESHDTIESLRRENKNLAGKSY
jgi:peptidoglycan hydrolase CwlO-like protein